MKKKKVINISEIMYNLLSYEPMETIEGSESEFIKDVLDNSQIPTTNLYLYELFAGYCEAIQNEVTKNLAILILDGKKDTEEFQLELEKSFKWLKEWKAKYHADFVKDRRLYPVLFKKICYYLIVNSTIDDKHLFRTIGLKKKMTANWKIYTKYRKYAERSTYVDLPIIRSGKKLPYLTNMISSVFFECHRYHMGYGAATTVESCPKFVDVFGGTGTVAASINIPSEKKVLNEFDNVLMLMLTFFINYKQDLLETLAELHNQIMDATFPYQGYYTDVDLDRQVDSASDYSTRIERTENLDIQALLKVNELYNADYWRDRSNVIIATLGMGKEEAEEYREKLIESVEYRRKYIIAARNLFQYCEKQIQAHANAKFNFNAFDNSYTFKNSSVFKDYRFLAAYCYYYYSFRGLGGGNKNDEIGINDKSYCEYLNNTFGIKITDDEINIPKIIFDSRIKFKASMLYKDNFRVALNNATLTADSFENVLGYYDEGDFKRAFYYLDSPYFLTRQYGSAFSDAMHVEMLDKLRVAKYDWLFSMQYYKKNEKGTGQKVRGNILIKDYYTYYTGFVAPFKKEGKYYLPTYQEGDKIKDLYVILIDFTRLKDSIVLHNRFKDSGNEMFVLNRDVSAVIPYNSGYVQLPFAEFFKCMNQEMDYKDIVEYAYEYRRSQLKEYLY